MNKFDETKTASATRQPGFVLLEEEEGPSAEASAPQPAPQPSASSPEAAAPAAAPEPAPQAQARPTAELPTITPDPYMPPELGGVRPLSELAQAEVDIATSKELAVDVEDKKAASISKVKFGVTAGAVVIALLIGWSMFGPSHAPAPVAPTQPVATTPGAPQPGMPGAPVDPTAPAAPTVGIDIGNTQGISLETGDIDMIEQWTPVAPAEQSCTAQVMSPYLQAVCKKAGQARYFQCSPDGFHWDYRIQGCAQL